ncbi:MAG: hypothetical protein NTY96_01180 [Bacteroidetes bacterium]|nr:hypothetical protein [Bacteroidota bacterium]
MKKIGILLLTCFFLLAGSSVFSQKLKSGDLSLLKGQKVINLQYDYSKMKVGKYVSEEEYIADGTADRNKKKEGSGEEWAAKWRTDKGTRFQPKFETNLNGKLNKCGLEGKSNATDAQYTLILHVTALEQGFQSGIGVSKPAYIDLVIDIVDSKAPDKPLAIISYPKCQSVNMMGYDYDTGSRVMSCFDRAGDDIGKLICKNLK